MNDLTGIAYLQIRRDGGARVKVIKTTQYLPSQVAPDCIVVKVKLNVPEQAFKPLAADLQVDVDNVVPISIEAQP